jgi:hypothetical protein
MEWTDGFPWRVRQIFTSSDTHITFIKRRRRIQTNLVSSPTPTPKTSPMKASTPLAASSPSRRSLKANHFIFRRRMNKNSTRGSFSRPPQTPHPPRSGTGSRWFRGDLLRMRRTLTVQCPGIFTPDLGLTGRPPQGAGSTCCVTSTMPRWRQNLNTIVHIIQTPRVGSVASPVSVTWIWGGPERPVSLGYLGETFIRPLDEGLWAAQCTDYQYLSFSFSKNNFWPKYVLDFLQDSSYKSERKNKIKHKSSQDFNQFLDKFAFSRVFILIKVFPSRLDFV